VPPAAPPSLSRIASRVEERLGGLLNVEQARWSDVDPDLSVPFHEIRRLVLAGGKRLRPAFCAWGYVGAGGDLDAPIVVDAGAALELMHAFALFHDDVMDGSDTRRSEPTTHVVAGREHTARGWSGEARRYGEGVAILVGDLAFVYADGLLAGISPAAWAVWNELRIELNIGQYLDILGSARRERRRVYAERICRYTSGKYTIERPLHLGAVLAAPERVGELVPALSRYGLPLGDAFQMRDDVLGAFGDSELTGKTVGDDLREGKPTPLAAIAVERATPAQRAILDRIGTPGLTDADIIAIQEAIEDSGALAELESHIAALTDEALVALDAVPIEDSAKVELTRLAGYVSWREV
jgi:geranylgeranyl diphosphate synthase type I